MDLSHPEIVSAIFSFVAALTASILAVREIKKANKLIEQKIYFTRQAKTDANATFDLIERLVSQPQTPEDIKHTLRQVTEAIIDDNQGRRVICQFESLMQDKDQIENHKYYSQQLQSQIRSVSPDIAREFETAVRRGFCTLLAMHHSSGSTDDLMRSIVSSKSGLLEELTVAFKRSDPLAH